jgi:two-component system, NarL family, nitrate/nitrite response regulator NarL
VSQTTQKVRIAVVDPHAMFAECLCLVLDVRGHHAVQVALPEPPAGAPSALLASILRQHPDVVILDIQLGIGWDGIGLVQPLARSGAKVVIVTGDPDRGRWGEALMLGARGVLPKHGPLSAITSAVRRLADGAAIITVEQRRALIETHLAVNDEQRMRRTRLEKLTAGEGEILGHLMLGRTVSDIADQRVVSMTTVRTQVKSILAKLEVSSQLAAVGLAHHSGWLPPDIGKAEHRPATTRSSTSVTG